MGILGSESQRLGNLSVWEKEAGHMTNSYILGSLSSTHSGH